MTTTRRTRWWSLPLIGLLWLSGLALLYWAHYSIPQGAITEAQFLPGGYDAQPDPNDPRWQNITLPHFWNSSPQQRGLENAWYRLPINFNAPQTADPPGKAVLLWQVGTNARLYLNGEWLGDGGPMRAPIAHNEFRPLLFSVPTQLAAQGTHELMVQVRGVPAGTGFLGPVLSGPMQTLRPSYKARHFLKITAHEFIVVLFLVTALPSAIMAFWRTRDTLYAWFAAFGFTYALTPTTFLVRDANISVIAREWIFGFGLNGAMYALSIFLLRYLGLTRPRFERGIFGVSLVICTVMTAYALAQPADYHLWSRGLWSPLSVTLVVYPVLLLLHDFWSKPQTAGFWLAVIGNLMLILGVHDLLVLNHRISPEQGYWHYYPAALGFMVFSVILMRRFQVALLASENHNLELARRVQEKENELEAKHAELREVEQRQILAIERERLMRDMHDGLGGTLVSTLSRLESDGAGESPAAKSMRRALEDLRLLLFSLEPSTRSLRAAVAMLRERIDALAEDVGLQIEWNIQLADDFKLERRETLQVMRVVQEAFTNIIKHANASVAEIKFHLNTDATTITVEVCDDGVGFNPADTSGSGLGLGNMRSRARSLGGELNIFPDTNGTIVRLSMPAFQAKT